MLIKILSQISSVNKILQILIFFNKMKLEIFQKLLRKQYNFFRKSGRDVLHGFDICHFLTCDALTLIQDDASLTCVFYYFTKGLYKRKLFHKRNTLNKCFGSDYFFNLVP